MTHNGSPAAPASVTPGGVCPPPFQHPAGLCERAPYKLLDLFSGIGGFSLGLERTGGFKTVAFCEFDREARATLAERNPGVPIYDDVRELTGDRLRDDGIFPTAICGGFPCQDVSLAGAGEGLDGARSGLWFHFYRLICDIRPELVFVENVAALLGRGLDRVLGCLAAVGYDAEWHCIPASYVGARQVRDRVWIVAYPQRYGVQGRAPVTAAWCSQSRAEQLAGLVQPCSWPTVSGARNRGTGHGIPRGVHRNKQLGNAVVPQIPELIGRAILASQSGLCLTQHDGEA